MGKLQHCLASFQATAEGGRELPLPRGQQQRLLRTFPPSFLYLRRYFFAKMSIMGGRRKIASLYVVAEGKKTETVIKKSLRERRKEGEIHSIVYVLLPISA